MSAMSVAHKLNDMDENLRQITKIKKSKRKIGFTSEEFNTIIHSDDEFDVSFNEKIRQRLIGEYEGKCIGDGYVIVDTLEILNRSSITFPQEALQLHYTVTVEFEYVVCNPNPGVRLNCVGVSKSKIGIVAKLSSPLSPLIILIPNDLCDTKACDSDKTDFIVEVIGKKFEQNDKKITVIAKLI